MRDLAKRRVNENPISNHDRGNGFVPARKRSNLPCSSRVIPDIDLVDRDARTMKPAPQSLAAVTTWAAKKASTRTRASTGPTRLTSPVRGPPPRRREPAQGLDENGLFREGNRVHDRLDLVTATIRNRADQLETLLRQCEADLATVILLRLTSDQLLLHEPIAHSCSGGRRHSNRLGQPDQILRSTRREHDEGPVLREGDLLGDIGQRARGDRDEDSMLTSRSSTTSPRFRLMRS